MISFLIANSILLIAPRFKGSPSIVGGQLYNGDFAFITL